MLSVGLKYNKNKLNDSVLRRILSLPNVNFAGEDASDVDVLQVKYWSVETGLVELDGGVSVHQVSGALTAR